MNLRAVIPGLTRDPCVLAFHFLAAKLRAGRPRRAAGAWALMRAAARLRVTLQ